MTATTNGVADRYDFWDGNKALISNTNKEIAESAVTDVEIGYLDGVTSNIQTQINALSTATATIGIRFRQNIAAGYSRLATLNLTNQGDTKGILLDLFGYVMGGNNRLGNFRIYFGVAQQQPMTSPVDTPILKVDRNDYQSWSFGYTIDVDNASIKTVTLWAYHPTNYAYLYGGVIKAGTTTVYSDDVPTTTQPAGYVGALGTDKHINSIKLDSLTASRVAVSDASKNIVSSTITTTELDYLGGVTSPIQNQFTYKQAIPTILGGLTVTGQTHWKIGTITFPGTSLSSFSGVLSLSTSSMANDPGEIRFAVDIRRNTSSLPTGLVIAGFADNNSRVQPNDLVFQTEMAAGDSNLVVGIYLRVAAVPTYEFYSSQMSQATGQATYAVVASGVISGLPTATWSTTSASRLAGTGDRLAQVDSSGRFSAGITVPTAFVQTIFDDVDAAAVRATIGASDGRELLNWYASRPTDCNLAPDGLGGVRSFVATSVMTANKPSQGDSHIIHLGWDNTGGYDTQIASKAGNVGGVMGQLQVRGQDAGTWGAWRTIWDTGNLTNLNQLTNGPGYLTGSGTNGYIAKFDASGNLVDSLLWESGGSITTASMYLHASAGLTDVVLASLVTGEPNSRFVINKVGVLAWGAGSTARDVNLYRLVANRLHTDDVMSAALGFRATGYSSTPLGGVDGPGIEMHYDSANTRGRVLAFDRTTNLRVPLVVDGLTIDFAIAGTTKAKVDASGNFNIANLTASQVVATDASKNLVSWDAATARTNIGAVASADLQDAQLLSLITPDNGGSGVNKWVKLGTITLGNGYYFGAGTISIAAAYTGAGELEAHWQVSSATTTGVFGVSAKIVGGQNMDPGKFNVVVTKTWSVDGANEAELWFQAPSSNAAYVIRHLSFGKNNAAVTWTIATSLPWVASASTGTVTSATYTILATSARLLGVTASRALVTDASNNVVASATTAAELGYLSGVTSAIQTQINSKWTLLDTRISDDVNNAGAYNRITDVATAAANNPGASTSYLLNIRNNAASTTYAGQLAITAGATDYGLAIRNQYNGTWRGWKYALLDVDNPDLVAIEALTGTSGVLKKTAANTWALDTALDSSYIPYVALKDNLTNATWASASAVTLFDVTIPAPPSDKTTLHISLFGVATSGYADDSTYRLYLTDVTGSAYVLLATFGSGLNNRSWSADIHCIKSGASWNILNTGWRTSATPGGGVFGDESGFDPANVKLKLTVTAPGASTCTARIGYTVTFT